jgi:hypothetical protein
MTVKRYDYGVLTTADYPSELVLTTLLTMVLTRVLTYADWCSADPPIPP